MNESDTVSYIVSIWRRMNALQLRTNYLKLMLNRIQIAWSWWKSSIHMLMHANTPESALANQNSKKKPCTIYIHARHHFVCFIVEISHLYKVRDKTKWSTALDWNGCFWSYSVAENRRWAQHNDILRATSNWISKISVNINWIVSQNNKRGL